MTRKKAWLIAVAIQVVFVIMFLACMFAVGIVAGDVIRPGIKAFAVKCGIAGAALAAIFVIALYYKRRAR